MKKNQFRNKLILKVSRLEEITREEYVNRNCNLDMEIKFEDGSLYYKPLISKNYDIKQWKN